MVALAAHQSPPNALAFFALFDDAVAALGRVWHNERAIPLDLLRDFSADL
jgi:hypothetical protein